MSEIDCRRAMDILLPWKDPTTQTLLQYCDAVIATPKPDGMPQEEYDGIIAKAEALKASLQG